MNTKLVITGGSGFVGKAVCRLASQRNITVISLSRHGRPEGIVADDFRNVQWIQADIFEPDTWRDHLKDTHALIHCIGIIEEHVNHTYEKMIFTSARIAGDEARRAQIPKFVFVSAGAAAPETPQAYMKMKIATESFLIQSQPDLTILRPGMIYGEDRPESVQEYEMIRKLLDDPHVSTELKENKPLHVNIVAFAALESALGHVPQKILTVEAMEMLMKQTTL